MFLMPKSAFFGICLGVFLVFIFIYLFFYVQDWSSSFGIPRADP